jgi:hypothetical protein
VGAVRELASDYPSGEQTMSRQIWLSRLMGMGLALALCCWATPTRAGDEGNDDSGGGGVPELDPRAAGLALTILGGSPWCSTGAGSAALALPISCP